jgi:hypothetical protein
VEWLTIARTNRLLYGINLERGLSDAGRFGADHAALVWKVPENDDFLATDDQAYSDASLAYSSRMKNLTEAQIVNASFTVSLPFVGATAEAGRADRQARNEIHKTLHMTGKWNYPRARLRLQYCTALAPPFITGLENALQLRDEAARFAALRGVFDSFGQVVAQEVVLGGQMFFQMEKQVSASVNEDDVKTTIQAAISIETTKGGGGGDVGFAVGTGKRVQAQDIAQDIQWHCVGGDTTKPLNEWPDTVKDPNSWRIIERDVVVSLTDRLQAERPDLAERVRDTWEKRLKTIWAGHAPPPEYILPPFEGEAFTMSRDGATNAPTLSASPRKPMTTAMFETLPGNWGGTHGLAPTVRQGVGKIAELKPYLDELDRSEDQPGFGRLLADTQGLYDPAGRTCLWQLVFSGAVDSVGRPYFWIVQFDQASAESTLMATASPKTLAAVVDINPLDNLDRPELMADVRRAVIAQIPGGQGSEMWDQLAPMLGPLIRPLLGYVTTDRVLANPPLRLDDAQGVLNGAFWTVDPVEGGADLYVFRSASGFSFALGEPSGIKTGDEIHVWRDQKQRSVYCRIVRGARPESSV